MSHTFHGSDYVLDRIAPWLLCGFTIFILRSWLGPGLPIFFDAHSHLARSWMVSEALRAGAFPAWTNAWYGGYPLLEFHSPLYYYTAGALTLMVGDVVLATKLLNFGAQLGIVLGFYSLLRQLGQRAAVAAVGSALLLKSSLVSWLVGTVGNYPSLVVAMILPLLLRRFLCRAGSQDEERGGGYGLAVGQGLLWAAMMAGHLSNSVAQVAPLLAFQLSWLWESHRSLRAAGTLSLYLAGALVLATLLQAFNIVPMLSRLDGTSLLLLRFDPPLRNLDFVPLLTLAGLRPHSLDYSYAHSTGLLFSAVAVGMSLFSLGGRGRRWRPLSFGLGTALISIPLVGDRTAISAVFFGLALCGAALHEVTEIAHRWRPAAGNGLIAVAALAVLAWPGAVSKYPVPRFQPADALDVYAQIPDSATQSRTFDLTRSGISADGFYGWSSFSPAVSGRSIPFGAFPQASSLDINVLMALASIWVEDNRRGGGWSELSLDAFFLAHVEFLIDRAPGEAPSDPPAPAHRSNRLSRQLHQLEEASPVLFSERLSPLPPKWTGPPAARASSLSPLLSRLLEVWTADGFKRDRVRDSALRPVSRTRGRRDWTLLAPVVEAMGIDRRRAVADQLFSAHGGSRKAAPALPRVDFELLEHSEGPVLARLVVRASRSGHLRVSYSYDRDLRVTLDGSPVPILPDALGGAFLMDLPRGNHSVEIRPPDPTFRAGLAIACGLAWIALLPTALSRRRRSDEEGQRAPSRMDEERSAR